MKQHSGIHVRIMGLATACMLVLGINTALASLIVSDGESVTFDTDAGSYSGDYSGTGFTVSGGVALFDFSAIDFQSGSTIIFEGSNAVHLQSDGAFTINTALNVGGGSGTGGGTGGGGIIGGYDGGSDGSAGSGPGAGLEPENSWHGGSGAGYGGEGGKGSLEDTAGQPYSNERLVDGLLGGSGGASGGDGDPGGGGAGGGAIRLEAGGLLSLQSGASILAHGGKGGNRIRAGGGGSGGTISLLGDSIELDSEALIRANGGDGGETTTGSGRDGGGGGGGRILFDADTLTIDGSTQDFGFLSSGQLSVAGGLGGQGRTESELYGEDGAAGTIYFIPEPGSVLLLGLGGLMLALLRRKLR